MVHYMVMDDEDDEPMAGAKAMTLEEVEKCAVRDKEFCESERGQYCMVFYHDVLLAKVGCTEHWGLNVRTRMAISKAYHEKTRAQPQRYRIPADMGAFLCAQFKSSHGRWKLIAKGKKEKGNKWTPSPKDETYHSTYTKPKDGLTGYTADGRKYFGQMRKKIIKGRAEDHVEELEAGILHLVR